MTSTEVDRLERFVGQRLTDVQEDVRELRDEARRDHQAVRAELQDLAARVSKVEQGDHDDETRQEFIDSIVKRSKLGNLDELLGRLAVVMGQPA